MSRISLFVVLFASLLASAAVAARDATLEANPGETCAEKREAHKNAAPQVTRGGVPARQTKAKTGAGSEAPGHRLQSPRWHSFLPGMFR